jgi:AraC-like DNA-binding protein
METFGDRVVFSYSVVQPNVEATDQVGDAALAIMHNILRELCGPQWRPAGILFAHRRPTSLAPFQKLFAAPLIFNAEQYAIVFPSIWMDRHLDHDDPELRRLLQAQMEALEAQYGDDLASQLRGLLRTALLTGHAGEVEIAKILSVHTRTLSRRLAAAGTSFQELVDECSFEISQQMLEYTRHDVAQIAAALDYADSSAFTRAFRRWSGTTPARWRAAQAGRSKPAARLSAPTLARVRS